MKKDKIKPQLAAGFSDLSGSLLATKKRLIKIIEANYLRYGAQEIELPILEISSQIGSYLAEDESNPMADVFEFKNETESLIARYDLTAQMVRNFCSNYRELPSIFKNYRIGEVFRQEKASMSSGRYRQFCQGDFDVLGATNIAQTDAEICNLIADIFSQVLSRNQFKVNISNLKILEGLITNDLKITDPKKIQKISRSIDKKSRLGMDAVKNLLGKGNCDSSGAYTDGVNLSNNQIDEIINFLKIKELKDLKSYLKSPLSIEGINEIEQLLEMASYGDFLDCIEVSTEIQRGLSYYNSNVFETTLNVDLKNDKGISVPIGSCASGGRYFFSRFGIDITGSGMSIGISRLALLLDQLDKQKKVNNNGPVCILVLDKKYYSKYFEILKILRDNEINSEIYPGGDAKLQKQLIYCEKIKAPIAILCADTEFNENKISMKFLQKDKSDPSKQITIPKEELIKNVQKYI